MHIESTLKHWRIWLPDLILFATFPILLFPTINTLLTLIALLVVITFWLRTPNQSPTPFTPPLLLFTLMLGVSIIVTADPDLTLSKFTGILLGLTVWRIYAQRLTNQNSLMIGILIFILVGLGFTTLGVMNTVWHSKVPLIAQFTQKLPPVLIRLPEAASAGIQPNQVAGTVLIYLPFLFSLLIGWQSARYRKTAVILLIVTTFLVTAILILTQSRGGWVGGLAGLIILAFLWAWFKLPHKWVIMALLVCIMVGIGAVAAIGPQTILNIWLDPPDESVIGRLASLGFRQEVWHWALAGIHDFPFTGMGLGSFRLAAPRLYPINISPTYDIAHAHNIFLQTALDIGLPGLVAYVAMVLLMGLLGWQVARRDENLRPFALGLLAGLAAFHVYGLNDALALGSKTAVLFWLALGLITAMHKMAQRSTTTL